MTARFLLIVVFWVVVSTGFVRAETTTCHEMSHRDQTFTVCAFDPTRHDIRLFSSENGVPYRNFHALQSKLRAQNEYMLFGMNGGMYQDDLSAVGLLIENGVERKAISTKAGWGNFHLKPNGVFYVMPGAAGVKETSAFLKSGIKPLFATQSGPMLVIDGKLHPAFLPDSDSYKIRNGVGVGRDGQVYFVLSSWPVRFYDFATLFRDALGCDNALFLDGSISSLYRLDTGRRDGLFPMGPMIAVIGKTPG